MNANGQNFPTQAFTPNYADKNYMRAYHSLYQAAGVEGTSRGLDITYPDFARGNTLYGFDFTADLSEGPHVDPIKYGSLRVEGHFKVPLPEPMNYVLYLEYDNTIQIDRARNVLTDFPSV